MAHPAFSSIAFPQGRPLPVVVTLLNSIDEVNTEHTHHAEEQLYSTLTYVERGDTVARFGKKSVIKSPDYLYSVCKSESKRKSVKPKAEQNKSSKRNKQNKPSSSDGDRDRDILVRFGDDRDNLDLKFRSFSCDEDRDEKNSNDTLSLELESFGFALFLFLPGEVGKAGMIYPRDNLWDIIQASSLSKDVPEIRICPKDIPDEGIVISDTSITFLESDDKLKILINHHSDRNDDGVKTKGANAGATSISKKRNASELTKKIAPTSKGDSTKNNTRDTSPSTKKKKKNDTKEYKKQMKRDPLAPKTPANVYTLYFRDKKPILQELYPELPLCDIRSLIEKDYREITADEKQKYQKLAMEDKKRYKDELAKYNEMKENECDDHDDTFVTV